MRKLFILSILITTFFLLCGCGKDASYQETLDNNKKIENDNGHYPVTVKNYNSARKKIDVVFDKKPTRVVADQQHIIEMLLALEQHDSLVATSVMRWATQDFLARYEKEKDRLPPLNRYSFDLETMLVTKPDLIIGWHQSFTARNLRSTDYWKERGVNTYIIENSNAVMMKGTLQDEYNTILNMGKIFNCEKLAEKIVADIQNEITTTIETTKGRPKQRALIVEYMGAGMLAWGPNRLCGDMVRKLGGELVDCSFRIGPENLLEIDPDVLFVVCTDWQEDAEIAVKRFTENQSFRSLKAVRNKRVYAIPLVLMYASSTRTLEGIKVFKNGLYPDLKG